MLLWVYLFFGIRISAEATHVVGYFRLSTNQGFAAGKFYYGRCLFAGKGVRSMWFIISNRLRIKGFQMLNMEMDSVCWLALPARLIYRECLTIVDPVDAEEMYTVVCPLMRLYFATLTSLRPFAVCMVRMRPGIQSPALPISLPPRAPRVQNTGIA
jgi:hypothetical protein